jgi:hypothetical protein
MEAAEAIKKVYHPLRHSEKRAGTIEGKALSPAAEGLREESLPA